MVIIIISLLVGFVYYRTAITEGVNGIFYGILATVFCYGAFQLTRLIIGKLFGASESGENVFGGIGSLIGCILVYILLISMAKVKREKELLAGDK
jgi:ABC-type Co2+ transport system permease subunit